MVECLECGAEIHVPEDAGADDVVACRVCGESFVVIAVDPVELDYPDDETWDNEAWEDEVEWEDDDWDEDEEEDANDVPLVAGVLDDEVTEEDSDEDGDEDGDEDTEEDAEEEDAEPKVEER